jgi:rod shape-determining protein MreC
MGSNGVIGRVISSGTSTARVLLLTDFNSHIPVVAVSSDVQAILSGTNRVQPELQFLPRQANLKDGDLLVTSGRGGQIPMGLPVALVERDAENKTGVRMLDDLAQLNFVRIVKTQEIEAPPAEIQLSPSQRAER